MPIMTNTEDCIDSLRWAITELNKLEKIRDAVAEYNHLLTTRKHGGEAQNRAFERIVAILDMRWQG